MIQLYFGWMEDLVALVSWAWSMKMDPLYSSKVQWASRLIIILGIWRQMSCIFNLLEELDLVHQIQDQSNTMMQLQQTTTIWLWVPFSTNSQTSGKISSTSQVRAMQESTSPTCPRKFYNKTKNPIFNVVEFKRI